MELENQYKDILYDAQIEMNGVKNLEPRRAFFMGKSGMGKSYCFEGLLELGKIDSHFGGEMGDQYLKNSSYIEQGITVNIFDTISIDFLEIDFQRENKVRDQQEAYFEYKALFQEGFHRIFLFVKYDRVPIMKENLKTTMLQFKKYQKNITLIVTQAPFEEKQILMEEFVSITRFYNISQNAIVIGKDFDPAGLRLIILSHMWNDKLIKDFQIEGTLFDQKFCNDMSQETKECFLQLQQQIKGVQCECSGKHKYSCRYYQEPKVWYKSEWKNPFQSTIPLTQSQSKNNSYKQMESNGKNSQQSKTNNYKNDSWQQKEIQGQQNLKEKQDKQEKKQQQKEIIQEPYPIQNQFNSNQISWSYNQNQQQQFQEDKFDLYNYFSTPTNKQKEFKILFTGFENNNKQTILNRLINKKTTIKQNQQQCSYVYNQESFSIILQNDLILNKQIDNISSIKLKSNGCHKIYLFIDLISQDVVKQSTSLLNNIGVPQKNITLVFNNADYDKTQSEMFKSQYNVINYSEKLEADNIKQIISHDILNSQQLDPIVNQQRLQQNIQPSGFNNRK